MNDHGILGSCGAFLRAVASRWSSGGWLHHDAAQAHETGKPEKASTSLPAAIFVGMLDQTRREFRAKGR